ncbi:glycosyltransferase [Pontibacter rugosus]
MDHLYKLKPDLIIVCTHELLLPSLRYCKASGAKLVYDVQENYRLNLTSQKNYPLLVRQFLARGVSRAEKIAAPEVAHILLAERSYAEELTFLQGRSYTFIENKYKPGETYTLPATPVKVPQEPLRLLYSGTIATMYGVFEAVALAAKLYALDQTVTLTIIGYSSRQDTLQQLKQVIHNKPYIKLIGGDALVPHQQILEEIDKSNIGLLPYQPHPSTFRCIPTKLYEYMAHGLPVLIQQNPLWASITEANTAGISIDFQDPQPLELLTRIRQQHFYTSGLPDDIFWKSEEHKILPIIFDLLYK